mmetsp:Transcript_23780/g.74856  ORF Transcript_23780/g.74856 Transcript_23780/m.74856 type:complete len:340 (-) Transcript_23780:941-1960(-)
MGVADAPARWDALSPSWPRPKYAVSSRSVRAELESSRAFSPCTQIIIFANSFSLPVGSMATWRRPSWACAAGSTRSARQKRHDRLEPSPSVDSASAFSDVHCQPTAGTSPSRGSALPPQNALCAAASARSDRSRASLLAAPPAAPLRGTRIPIVPSSACETSASASSSAPGSSPQSAMGAPHGTLKAHACSGAAAVGPPVQKCTQRRFPGNGPTACTRLQSGPAGGAARTWSDTCASAANFSSRNPGLRLGKTCMTALCVSTRFVRPHTSARRNCARSATWGTCRVVNPTSDAFAPPLSSLPSPSSSSGRGSHSNASYASGSTSSASGATAASGRRCAL